MMKKTAIAVALALVAGCASETVKVVEGTDLSVGFTIPGMEGEANFTVFNYLSGFKTTTAESNRVKLKYTCAESNEYFGVITTRVHKGVEAEIEPVVDEAEEEEEPEENSAKGLFTKSGTDGTTSTQKCENCSDADCASGNCKDCKCSK